MPAQFGDLVYQEIVTLVNDFSDDDLVILVKLIHDSDMCHACFPLVEL